MGIIKRSADLVYAFRFVRVVSTPWEDTDAFKLGIIDKDGKRVKSVKLDTSAKKDAYTPFLRLAYNIKAIIGKIPGGSNKLVSFTSALFLLKEKYELSDGTLDKISRELGVDPSEILSEKSEWFILEDQRISPGIYRLKNEKMLNISHEMIGNAKDKVRISENAYPVGDLFGMPIYEGIHIPTKQKIYITSGELIK